MRCERSVTISAPRWWSLITMLRNASTLSGKLGAGWRMPITVADLLPIRSCRPTTAESPPNRRSQNSCVSTITAGTPVPSSPGCVTLPRTGARPMIAK